MKYAWVSLKLGLLLCSTIVVVDFLHLWWVASRLPDKWMVCFDLTRSFIFGAPWPTLEPWFNLVVGIGAALALLGALGRPLATAAKWLRRDGGFDSPPPPPLPLISGNGG